MEGQCFHTLRPDSFRSTNTSEVAVHTVASTNQRRCRIETLERRNLLAATVAVQDYFSANEDAELVISSPGVLANDLSGGASGTVATMRSQATCFMLVQPDRLAATGRQPILGI